MILIGYDGSPDAQAAIDRAALLLPGVTATVLTLWEPLVNLVVPSAQVSAERRHWSEQGLVETR